MPEHSIIGDQTNMKKLILTALLGVAALVADAQQAANVWTNLATLPAVITPAATSNLVSAPVFINPGYGISLEVAVRGIVGNETTTSNVTARVNLSLDGTNYLTTAPLALVGVLSGTNTIVFGTNFPASLFDGFAKARVESLTSASISNVIPVSVKIGRARQNFTRP